MNEHKQFFIRVGGQLVAVAEEVYREYYRMSRRERYLEERDAAHGKALYSDMDTEEMTGEGMIPGPDAKSVEQTAIDGIMTNNLRQCLALLSEDERKLIEMLYFANNGVGMTQREAAVALGISQPAVKKRRDKIIGKLRSLIIS